MSKPTTLVKTETLHTCPKCSQPGFTAAGLKAHQGGKTCKARAGQLIKSDATQMKEFDAARSHIAKLHELGRRTQHEMVLLGFALNQAKKELGIKAGRPSGKLPHGAEIKSWEEIVVEQTGLSLDTCDRWMKIAAGAAKSLPILMSKDVMEKPFNALPEARRQEVSKILHKAVDGQTMHSLMLTLGVLKDKAHKSPPKPTKKSAESRNENANNQTLTAEQLMQLAKEDRDALHDMHIGEAWKNLDDADLADLENKLTAYTAAVAAEHKARKGTK